MIDNDGFDYDSECGEYDSEADWSEGWELDLDTDSEFDSEGSEWDSQVEHDTEIDHEGFEAESEVGANDYAMSEWCCYAETSFMHDGSEDISKSETEEESVELLNEYEYTGIEEKEDENEEYEEEEKDKRM